MKIYAMVILAVLAFWWVRVIYNNVSSPNAATPIGYYIVSIVSAVILGIVWLIGGFN